MPRVETARMEMVPRLWKGWLSMLDQHPSGKGCGEGVEYQRLSNRIRSIDVLPSAWE